MYPLSWHIRKPEPHCHTDLLIRETDYCHYHNTVCVWIIRPQEQTFRFKLLEEFPSQNCNHQHPELKTMRSHLQDGNGCFHKHKMLPSCHEQLCRLMCQTPCGFHIMIWLKSSCFQLSAKCQSHTIHPLRRRQKAQQQNRLCVMNLQYVSICEECHSQQM